MIKAVEDAIASGPTAKAPKDPQPSVDRIDELARRILIGDILLPKFQRNFVWERSQVIDLLDSIARNFPIGSVLLWQSRQELRSENKIADLDIKLPKPDYPVNYLLDGQQRLSSICGALYWSGSEPRSIWNIAYDLRSKAFVHLDHLNDPPQHQIRVNKLSDPAAFFRHAAVLDTLTAPDRAVLKDSANQLFNRFKDYKVAVVTLGDMSIEDVAPIFERINSTGTPLTIVDLMRAATWSSSFDLIDEIEAILAILSDKTFGGIEKKAVLRNISAAAGGGFSTSSIDGLRRHDSSKLKLATDDTLSAYKKAVDFLSTQIKIPSDKLVPYINQIVVLVELFRLIPTPSAQQYSLIKQWFWRTAIAGYFGGWNTAMMASDIEAMRQFASGKSQIIDIPADDPSTRIWRDRQFRLNNAHAKVLALMFAQIASRDLLTGQQIDMDKALSWENSKEFHHLFPQAFLRARGVGQTKINSLANIILLSSGSNKAISDQSPSDYLKMVEKTHATELQSILDSNLISQEAFEAAKRNDFESFLLFRSQSIHEVAYNLTGWNRQ